MSFITDEEREMALETGTFEGAGLDEGYYVPVSVEVTSAGTFRLVFSEHGKEFTAEGDNSNLEKFLENSGHTCTGDCERLGRVLH